MANILNVLNSPSLWYTFDKPNGSSYIYVTLVNETAARKFSFEWRVIGGKSVSVHHLIEIGITFTLKAVTLEQYFQWSAKGANWSLYA